MALVKRYFSFVDPITGAVTKGYGYSVPRSQKNIVIKMVKNKPVVLKDETVENVNEIVPAYENVQEITEQEFDALDVAGESITSKLRREREVYGLKLAEKRLAAQAAPLTTRQIVEKFKKVAGK